MAILSKRIECVGFSGISVMTVTLTEGKIEGKVTP